MQPSQTNPFQMLSDIRAILFHLGPLHPRNGKEIPHLTMPFEEDSYRVVTSDHRNEQKRADYHNPGICMSTAVLLKERNREIVGVQTHISLALFTSRVNKDVSENNYLCVHYNEH